ncbi:hypothetical protein BH10PSE7_BH10PSE7_23520 [soil metagenome]
MKRGGLPGVVIAFLVGGIGGVASAHWAIDRAATASSGSWRSWIGNGPYASAHYLLGGQLPPARGVDLLYEADRDGEGQPLDSSCDYVLSGSAIGARWWRISVPGETGAINSAGAIGEPDGTLKLTVSRSTLPGNRMSPGDAGRYTLLLTLKADSPRRGGISVVELPRITRGECR